MQRADFFVCSVRTFLFAACVFILFAACEFFYLQRADLFCTQCADLFSLQCTLFCEMCNVLLYGGILPGKMCPLWASVECTVKVLFITFVNAFFVAPETLPCAPLGAMFTGYLFILCMLRQNHSMSLKL